MKLFPAIFLSLLCTVAPVAALLSTALAAAAQEPRLSVTGGGGTLLNLNDRMAEGVSATAIALTGAGELTLPDLHPALPPLRVATGLDLAFFSGSAFVGNVSLLVGVAKPFTFAGLGWEAYATLGPAFTLAPTRDAGSTWVSTVVKAGLRCESCPLGAGVYVSLQQIWMSDVKDPWMFGAGLEVRFDLHGRPAPVVMPVDPGKKPVKTPDGPAVDPEDPDGDGVKGATDACPSSGAGARVDANGCETVADGMALADGLFAPGGATLTTIGERECRRLAELLGRNAQLAVVLQVTAADDDLANLRYLAISKKLQELGVPGKRILSGTRAGSPESVTLAFRLLL
jgi:hypothetical protein